MEIALNTFCLVRKLLLLERLLQTTCQVSCFHMETSEKTRVSRHSSQAEDFLHEEQTKAIAYNFDWLNKCFDSCYNM